MNEFKIRFSEDSGKTPAVQPFDREEWIRQKRADREKAFEMIDQAAELAAKDGERVKTILDLQCRFPGYSVGNILLLSVQKPDAMWIEDYKYWKENNAFIRKGQTGIILLEPGNEYTRKDGSVAVSYNAKRVFDVSQTNRELWPRHPSPKDARVLISALISNAPCEVVTDDSVHFPEGMAARYDSGHHTIYAARDQEGSFLFREIARELAHAYLDHEGYDREKGEFTAVCVSYMLCVRSEVDASTFDFRELPESFQSLDSRGVRAELGKMRDITNRIAQDMEHQFELQKAEKEKAAER